MSAHSGANASRASTSPEVAIAGIGLWLPGFPTYTAWAEGVRDEDSLFPVGSALGPRQRRRAGMLGRSLSDASAEALLAAGAALADVPIVVGSSVGEAATLVGLLERMWRSDEPMSPAAFTISVHNAAAGVMSIVAGNRGFVTSLAADHDTPASALLEGLGLVLCEQRPVLVVCGDEEAPRTLLAGADAWDMLAAAVVLVPVDHPGPRLARLAIETPAHGARAATTNDEVEIADLERGAALNPQAGMVDLVAAVGASRTGRVRLDRGAGRGFHAVLRAAGQR